MGARRHPSRQFDVSLRSHRHNNTGADGSAAFAHRESHARFNGNRTEQSEPNRCASTGVDQLLIETERPRNVSGSKVELGRVPRTKWFMAATFFLIEDEDLRAT